MRILLIGDSEAGAVAPYLSSVQRPDDVVHTVYLVGSRIEAWSSGAQKPVLLQALASYAPDVVIVFLGTNHYSDSVAPPVASLLSVLQAAAPNASVLWVGPTSVQGKTWPVDTWLAQETAAAGVPYVDVEALGIPLRDGIHPTADGAKQLLQAIWARLPPTPSYGFNLASLSGGWAWIPVLSFALGAAAYWAFGSLPTPRYRGSS